MFAYLNQTNWKNYLELWQILASFIKEKAENTRVNGEERHYVISLQCVGHAFINMKSTI